MALHNIVSGSSFKTQKYKGLWCYKEQAFNFNWQPGWITQTHSLQAHCLCDHFFIQMSWEMRQGRHFRDMKDSLIRSDTFLTFLWKIASPDLQLQFSTQQTLFCPVRTTTQLCLWRIPGGVGPVLRSVCLLTLQGRALLEILLLFYPPSLCSKLPSS